MKKPQYKLKPHDEAILIVLNHHPDGRTPPGVYGLDISRIINANNEMKAISPGSLYPALQTLQEHGYVKGRWGKDVPGQKSSGARRRYYTITDAGVAALGALANQRSALIERAQNWRTDESPEPEGNTALQYVSIGCTIV